MICSKMYSDELKYYAESNADILSALEGKCVLITGAAALIGTYLIDLLMVFGEISGKRIRVIAVDKNSAEMESRFSCFGDNEALILMTLDVSETAPDVREGVDYIIHAASNTSPVDYANDPVGTMNTNVIGTYRLLEFARENGVKRFLLCSSVEAYGQNVSDAGDFDELSSGYVDCNTARAAYPSAKRASESMCCAYNSQYSIDYVTARIGRIYGPTVYLNDTKAPTQFILNAVRGENVVLKSNGMQLFSYGYVGDCVTAMLTILVRGECAQAYNIADSASKIRLKDFAGFCAAAAGTELVFVQQNEVEKKGYSKITQATLNTEKLESLGWHAEFSAEEGVKRTVSYIKNYRR
ncbi:MAG: NAD-dependent epimerase/dehydratase family protein [Clostridiales bacterium]|nr:NAD-dependent epimerase/dehydratase family protein [Clostridiales bacterium]